MSTTADHSSSFTANRALQIAPWLMLASRLLVFAGLQVTAAAVLAVTGSTRAWAESATWWPLYITIANALGFAWLTRLYRAEGQRYLDVFRLDRAQLGRDLLTVLGLVAIAAPLSMLPNPLLATALFGDSQAVVPLLFGPSPAWAMVPVLAMFALSQGLVV